MIQKIVRTQEIDILHIDTLVLNNLQFLIENVKFLVIDNVVVI